MRFLLFCSPDSIFSRMKRSFDPAVLEMMDRPQPVSTELERDLERLRQLNRWFGSHRLVSTFVRRWILPGAQMRVVDLATGSGDIPRLVVDHARKIGAQIEIDAVDQQPATLEIARRLSAEYPEISYHVANILEWDGAQGYDIALCSLVLHHFSDDDAVKLLRRCRALSKRFVLATGGSIVNEPETFSRLRSACYTVWLKAKAACEYS